MKLLHVDTSILGDNSASRQISAAIVDSFAKTSPDLDITYRDLAADPLPHLSGLHFAAASGAVVASDAPDLREEIAAAEAALDEFMAADIVVIGAPMYNFTIPSQLKAWIDRILVAGKTFRYGANGPEGLVGGKQVVLAISRGGLYGPGMPAAAAEHLESYLRVVFGFMGISDLQIIVAEGLMMGPEHREKSVSRAMAAAVGLARQASPQPVEAR